MRMKILLALMSIVSMGAAAQNVAAEETASTNKPAAENIQFEQESSFGYGLYGGVGYSSPVSELRDNFGGNFIFQIGAVGTYDRFQLKTDVQFGQPGYRNDNMFAAPAYDAQGHPSQVNGSSSASFLGWSVQVGYKVYENGRFSITPNVGINYTKYSWNLNNLKWTKNEDNDDYKAEVTGTESAKLTNLGFIASVDLDYTFSSTKVKNPFTGNGDDRLRQSVRITPFVAYAKYDKCSPSVKGAFVGVTINYFGLLHSLGL